MTQHILIVEDEIEVANTVEKFLRASGFTSTHLIDGLLVEPFVLEHKPALIVLDVMLPGKNGVDICRGIRQHTNIPVIMLTACVSESERLAGLDMGADDYVCKPFSAPELVMRIKNILGRFCKLADMATLVVDPEISKAKYQQKTIDLTSAELALLNLLQSQPQTTFSRDDIINSIYQDYRIVTDRTVDSHVRNLRKKLKTLSAEHEFIQSVYGAGYRFVPVD